MVNQTNGQSVPIKIRLGNQDFVLERKTVPVDWLKLDPRNQRLSYQLTQLRKEGKKGTDQELHELLWAIDQVKDLYQSVLQNGGLIDDPFVSEDGLVVEGNSRTVVLRELRKKYPADDRFATVPVRILPQDVTDEQLVTLLGELHIAGKIEWRAYEQAEYVWRMNKEFGKTYDFLAAHLRWSRSKITQKIGAYEETKIYLGETNDPNGLSRFSHFEELMKKKDLRVRKEKDPEFMKEFRSWVYQGKFPDAKDVRVLPEVLKNQAALDTLGKKNIQAAEAVLNQGDPSRTSDLYFSIDEAVKQLSGIPLTELKELEAGKVEKVEKLQKLHHALQDIAVRTNVDLK